MLNSGPASEEESSPDPTRQVFVVIRQTSGRPFPLGRVWLISRRSPGRDGSDVCGCLCQFRSVVRLNVSLRPNGARVCAVPACPRGAVSSLSWAWLYGVSCRSPKRVSSLVALREGVVLIFYNFVPTSDDVQDGNEKVGLFMLAFMNVIALWTVRLGSVLFRPEHVFVLLLAISGPFLVVVVHYEGILWMKNLAPLGLTCQALWFSYLCCISLVTKSKWPLRRRASRILQVIDDGRDGRFVGLNGAPSSVQDLPSLAGWCLVRLQTVLNPLQVCICQPHTRAQVAHAVVTNELLPDTVVGINTSMFIVAGRGCTFTAITMLLYHVASHPEVEEKAFEEVSLVVGGEPLTWDMLEKLVYRTQVVKENIRLYPLVPQFFKDSPPGRETTLGKYKLPPVSSLLFATFPSIHAVLYSFNTDCWEAEDAAKSSPYAWVPLWLLQAGLHRLAAYTWLRNTSTCF